MSIPSCPYCQTKTEFHEPKADGTRNHAYCSETCMAAMGYLHWRGRMCRPEFTFDPLRLESVSFPSGRRVQFS